MQSNDGCSLEASMQHTVEKWATTERIELKYVKGASGIN